MRCTLLSVAIFFIVQTPGSSSMKATLYKSLGDPSWQTARPKCEMRHADTPTSWTASATAATSKVSRGWNGMLVVSEQEQAKVRNPTLFFPVCSQTQGTLVCRNSARGMEV